MSPFTPSRGIFDPRFDDASNIRTKFRHHGFERSALTESEVEDYLRMADIYLQADIRRAKRSVSTITNNDLKYQLEDKLTSLSMLHEAIMAEFHTPTVADNAMDEACHRKKIPQREPPYWPRRVIIWLALVTK